MKRYTVAVADESRLFREGLEHLLRSSEFSVLAMGKTPADALQAASAESAPDLLLATVASEDDVRQVLELHRGRGLAARPTHLVLLTDRLEAGLVSQVTAPEIGALLSKDISGQVLQRSLELVMLGQKIFPPGQAAGQAERPLGKPTPVFTPYPLRSVNGTKPTISLIQGGMRDRLAAPEAVSAEAEFGVVLSGREDQILQWLLRGLSNKAIARELQISEATVKVHVKGLLRKIRVGNRTQAAIWATKNTYKVGETSNRSSAEVALPGAYG